MFYKAKKIFYNAFHYLFIVTFLLILGLVFMNKETIGDKFIMLISTTLCLFIIVALYWLITKSKLQVGRFGKKEILILFLIFICIQLILGISLRVKPSWDFGFVYDEAVRLTETGNWTITNKSYFLMYPNNQFYLVTLTCIFKFFSFFHITNYVVLGILVNIVFVDLSLWVLFLCMKKLWGYKIAVFGLILSFLCNAYITYLPIFYTDTFPLLFTNISLLLYIVIMKEKDIRKCAGYMILLVISCMIGFEYKATVIIVFIAIVLHMFFLLPSKKGLFLILLGCIGFAGSAKLYSFAFDQSNLLDATQQDRYNYPYSHWLMMGLKTPGGYNEKDFYYTKSFITKQEKTDANLKVINQRLSDMGGIGVIQHLAKKINYTWSDGTYFSSKLVERKPLTKGIVRNVFAKGGKYESVFNIYADGMHYAILVLMVVSGIYGLYQMKKTKQMDFISCIRLAIYGLFVFLLIWESKSKYLVNFLPLLYLVAIDGMNGIWMFLKKKENRYYEIGNRSTLL